VRGKFDVSRYPFCQKESTPAVERERVAYCQTYTTKNASHKAKVHLIRCLFPHLDGLPVKNFV